MKSSMQGPFKAQTAHHEVARTLERASVTI